MWRVIKLEYLQNMIFRTQDHLGVNYGFLKWWHSIISKKKPCKNGNKILTIFLLKHKNFQFVFGKLLDLVTQKNIMSKNNSFINFLQFTILLKHSHFYTSLLTYRYYISSVADSHSWEEGEGELKKIIIM